MARKLTIVVTCTDGKSRRPDPHLTVRSLTAITPAGRLSQWRSRVSQAKGDVALRDLYQGQLWSSSLQLERTAVRAGYQVEMFVASAGLGLRSVDAIGVPYAATFSKGHPDSVGSTDGEIRDWWNGLTLLPDCDRLEAVASKRTLIVASEAYSLAMRDDLKRLGASASGKQIVLFGGAEDLPGVARVAANRSLRSALGGSITTLNVRSAIRWLERDEDREFVSDRLIVAWNRWSRRAAVSEPYGHERLTDESVTDFIRSHLRTHGLTSRTAVLRALRDSGRSCEQHRFARLYGEVVAP